MLHPGAADSQIIVFLGDIYNILLFIPLAAYIALGEENQASYSRNRF